MYGDETVRRIFILTLRWFIERATLNHHLSLPFYTFPYCCLVFNWLLNVTIPGSQSSFPGVLLTPPSLQKTITA